jgi:four helix bundle protein
MDEQPVGYEKLTVWKKADELAYQVYLATRNFPKDEIYGLTSQLRRSALSIPTNIAEGYSRQGQKELKQFVNIALGSLGEARYLLDFSSRMDYLHPKERIILTEIAEEVGRLLWKFYKSL